MKKLMALLGGLGCVAGLQACMVEPGSEEESISTVEGRAVSYMTITGDWGGVYCVNVNVGNDMSVPGNKWNIFMNMRGSNVQIVNGNKNVWNAVASAPDSNGIVTFTPRSYNSYVAPGGWTSFGFCATTWGHSAPRAVIDGHNMTSTQYAACSSNSGVNPTRASLAVAMANELGRWKPETDLTIGWDGKVALSSSGLARCSNGCANVKGLLGQQDDAVSNYIGQETFNATVFREDLKASFGRQYSKIEDLTRNNPGALPPAHKLTLVGGPTNMGGGACGPHYVYKVTDLNNNPLSQSQAASLANALCFYGQGSCGQNPYIGFVTTSQGCPSGQTCVAIDPDDYDTSSSGTSSAGSAPSYPLNRLWDPYNTKLNTKCTHSTGKLGYMKSKCSTSPSTCGYLYCTR